MLPKVPSVQGELCITGSIVNRFHGLQVAPERHLRVHDDALPTREVHDKIWPKGSIVRRMVLLLDEVDVLDHARRFHDSAKLELPPAPSDVGSPKSVDQVPRFYIERVGRRPNTDQLLRQGRRGFRSRFLCIEHLRLDPVESRRDGFDELPNGLFPFTQFGRPLGLSALESLLRLFQEHLRVRI